MRHRDDLPGEPIKLLHPSCGPREQIGDRFATVRGGLRIGEPLCYPLRIGLLNVAERTPCPAAEIAVVKLRLDHCEQPERFGRLHRAPRRTAPAMVCAAQSWRK